MYMSGSNVQDARALYTELHVVYTAKCMALYKLQLLATIASFPGLLHLQ